MSAGVRHRSLVAPALATLFCLSIASNADATVDASRGERLQSRLSRGAVVRLTTTSAEVTRLRDV